MEDRDTAGQAVRETGGIPISPLVSKEKYSQVRQRHGYLS